MAVAVAAAVVRGRVRGELGLWGVRGLDRGQVRARSAGAPPSWAASSAPLGWEHRCPQASPCGGGARWPARPRSGRAVHRFPGSSPGVVARGSRVHVRGARRCRCPWPGRPGGSCPCPGQVLGWGQPTGQWDRECAVPAGFVPLPPSSPAAGSSPACPGLGPRAQCSLCSHLGLLKGALRIPRYSLCPVPGPEPFHGGDRSLETALGFQLGTPPLGFCPGLGVVALCCMAQVMLRWLPAPGGLFDICRSSVSCHVPCAAQRERAGRGAAGAWALRVGTTRCGLKAPAHESCPRIRCDHGQGESRGCCGFKAGQVGLFVPCSRVLRFLFTHWHPVWVELPRISRCPCGAWGHAHR